MDETQDLETQINTLKQLLAQRDNDALEAIDELAAGVAECTNVLKIPQLIWDTLKAFGTMARTRINLRAELRELIRRRDGGAAE